MSVDQLTCMICLDVPTEAMESNCCHQLFCSSCAKPLTKCPNCRAKFSVIVAHFARRLIGQLLVPCPQDCGLTLPHSDLAQHALRCPRRPFICPAPMCKFSGQRQEYTDHLAGPHGDILVQHAERLFVEPPALGATGSFIAVGPGEAAGMRMKNGHTIARLGSTGKFYCRTPLGDPDCICCNGYCGPTNGCNCADCMLLDVKVRNLPKGWLVNKDGAPCRPNPPSGNTFYCGRCVLRGTQLCDGYCGPTNGPNCHACQCVSNQAQTRYRTACQQSK